MFIPIGVGRELETLAHEDPCALPLDRHNQNADARMPCTGENLQKKKFRSKYVEDTSGDDSIG